MENRSGSVVHVPMPALEPPPSSSNQWIQVTLDVMRALSSLPGALSLFSMSLVSLISVVFCNLFPQVEATYDFVARSDEELRFTKVCFRCVFTC
jgi:hypothetical protein